MLKIYTDGSAAPNPGPGGYGVVIMNQNEIWDYSNHQEYRTTNNRMELSAILRAVEIAQRFPEEHFIIYSDSAYCVNAINTWMYKWQKNDWKKKDGTLVENLDLIKCLYKYFSSNLFFCQIEKVQGHAGQVGNELADALATNNKEKFNKIVSDNDLTFKVF